MKIRGFVISFFNKELTIHEMHCGDSHATVFAFRHLADGFILQRNLQLPTSKQRVLNRVMALAVKPRKLHALRVPLHKRLCCCVSDKGSN